MGECKSAVYVRNGVASATSFEYQVKATGQAVKLRRILLTPKEICRNSLSLKLVPPPMMPSFWMPSFSSKNSFLELGRG